MISESNLFCGTSKTFCHEEEWRDIQSDLKLFKIELSEYYDIVDILIKSLTLDEGKRAERYRHIKDRNRFIICRSLLKYLLAKETKLDISKIQFEKYCNKKPYLPLNPSIHFNVSHAGNYGIIAIGTCELGVDIEYVNKGFDYKEILPNIFNKNEIDEVEKSNHKHLTFFRIWTRKEAIVKAIGKGIDDDFSKIPATDGFHSLSSSLVGDFKQIKVFSFNLNDDYVGAFAITEDKNNVEKIVFSPIPSSDQLKSLIQKKVAR